MGIFEPISIDSLEADKVRMFTYTQYWMGLLNHLGLCLFTAVPRPYQTKDVVEAVSGQCGWETSLWELLKVGQRGVHLARLFNARAGFGSQDDNIPARLFEPLKNGPFEGNSINPQALEKGKKMYYEMCGLDKNGAPLPGVQAELDIPLLLS